MIVGLVVGMWVARYLGPDLFGSLNYAIAFASLLGSLSGLGLDAIVVRNLVRESPEQMGHTLGTATALKAVASVIVLILSVVAILLIRPHDRASQEMVAIIAFASLFSAVDTIDFFFQSIVRVKAVVFARNAAVLVCSAVRISLILTKAPVVAFAWAQFLEACLGAVGLIVAYGVSGNRIRSWKFSTAFAVKLLGEGWLLMLSNMVIVIYMRIDQVMLGQMSSESSVGLYSAAERISELWFFVPMAICSSVSPTIISTRDVNPDLYRRRLQQLFTLLAALSYAVAILISLFARQIMYLLYGAPYMSGVSTLQVHVWTGIFVSLGVARQIWVVTEGYFKFSLYSCAAGAVVNVFLNLFLIPRYGSIGAAVATLVAQIVAVTLSAAFLPDTRRILMMQLRALVLNGGRLV